MKKRIFITTLMAIIIGVVMFIVPKFNNEIELSAEDRRALNYEQATDEGAVEGTDFVKFSAVFLRDLNKDGVAEELLGTCKELGTSDDLYINLNVLTEGYLENAKITINGNNFFFKTEEVTNGDLKKDYVSEDTKVLEFNRIDCGTQRIIIGQVRSGIYSQGDSNSALGKNINNYTMTSTITLTGTHVDDSGNSVDIEKTIPIIVDWYGKIQTEIYKYEIENTYQFQDNIPQNDEGILVDFTMGAHVTGTLLLKNNIIEGNIPQLQGYDPIRVECKSDKVSFEYDSTTRNFTIKRESVVDDSTGKITDQISAYNNYKIEVTYPFEAYQAVGGDGIAISFPIKAIYNGFNNSNEEFDNPYYSDVQDIGSVTYRRPYGRNVRVEVEIGEYYNDPDGYSKRAISKELPLNIYNGLITSQEKEDLYKVDWIINTGSQPADAGLILIEDPSNPNDMFNNIDGSSESIDNYSKFKAISFSNIKKLLGEDGWVEVYDADSNELIKRFEGQELTTYDSRNPYVYSQPITHVKVITSKYGKDTYARINHTKTLNDNLIVNDHTFEEFENIKSISTGIEGSMLFDDGEIVRVNSELNSAAYLFPYSIANVSVDKEWISTQIMQENITFTIDTASDGIVKSKWKDGIFLLKLPEDIYYVDINSVSANVTVDSYEICEVDGCKAIKVYTSNEEPKDVVIFINTDLACDPAVISKTETIHLYAENGACKNYYTSKAESDNYDINYNGNNDEKILHTTNTIKFISPSTLITSQQLSEYDDSDSITLAPNIADVAKKPGQQSAKVTIKVFNNYSSTITDTKIIGKIPNIGNTYPINTRDMGSEFDTKIFGRIVVPEELEDVVTIYYSTQEKVTNDIEARANDWKTDPEDFSKIKSYLIDFGDYSMPNGTRYEFSYDIEIDENARINQISYADHAIYYAINTVEGKYYTQTEPNKLGIRIVKKYNLELSKYEKGSSKMIPNTLYKITDVSTNESFTKSTNEEGKLVFTDLYAGRQYKLKELRANSDYVYDPNEISFTTSSPDGESLSINVLSGSLKSDPTIENDSLVKIQTENEVKCNLRLVKYDESSRNGLADVRFSLNGGGYSNRIFTTNSEGILNVEGLIPENEYTLREVEAKGYYIRGEDIKFKVERNGENLELNIISGEFVDNPNISVETGENRPTINIDYTNEKIPTYNFEVQKYKDGTNEPIKGVKFVVNGPTINNRVYETDANGKINVEGLYIYDENKDQDATYTIRETYAPDGFKVNTETISFSIKKEGNELAINTLDNNEVEYEFDQENNTFIIKIINISNFKITKIDKETGQPMPNVEFYLYSDDGQEIGGDSQKTIVQITKTYNKRFSEEDNYYEFINQDYSFGEIDFQFTLPEEGTIKFEWIPEISESTGSFYYSISERNQGEAVSYKSLDGIVYSGMIEQNIFESEEIELQEGEYIIEFYANNVDRAIVKNIEVSYGRDSGLRFVTDENGEINESINSGKYELREVTPEGYKATDPIKLGFGSSYDKHKALEFLSSELVEPIEVEPLQNEIIELGKGYYIEYFKDSFVDEASNVNIQSNARYNAILYKKNSEGIITGYVLFQDYYEINISKDNFIIDDNNVFFYDYMDYEINEEDYYGQLLIKFDENLNIINSKRNEGYGNTRLEEKDGKLYAYFSRWIYNGNNTIFGETYVANSSQTGANTIKVELDKDLNVLNMDFYKGTHIYNYDNGIVSFEVENSSIVGNTLLGYTFQESDVGKTVLLDVSGDTTKVIEKYSGEYIDTHSIIELGEKNLVIVRVETELTLDDGTVINTSSDDYYNYVFLEYDENYDLISYQIIAHADIEKIESKEDFLTILVHNNNSIVLNGTVEIADIDKQYIMFKYNIENGQFEGYTGVDTDKVIELNKISNNRYIINDRSTIKVIDDNFNTVWENKLQARPRDGSVWIDNIIEQEDGSFVMTYNILYYYSPQRMGSTSGASSSSYYYYNNKIWTESYLLKYDANGKLIFVRGINDIDSKIKKTVNNLTINNETEYAIKIDKLEIDTTDPEDTKYIVYANTNSNNEIKDKGYNKIIYHEVDMYDYPETNTLVIENEKEAIKHNIYTTYLNPNDSVVGNITGWTEGEAMTYNNQQKHIEKVKDGDNSTIQIKCQPTEGYRISKILYAYFNGSFDDQSSIEFLGQGEIVPDSFDENGAYTLPIFENVKSNIIVGVHFETIEGEVEVNHYIKGTDTKIAPTEYLYGDIDAEYKTKPHADLEEYTLEEDEEGNLILPDNKIGVFTEEKQIVNYYYVPKNPVLIVHHYLEGTEYSLAPDEIQYPEMGYEYGTNAATPPNIDEKYINVGDSGNTTGRIENYLTEVIYYYNVSEHKITTEVQGHGGTISGQGLDPYEVVSHGKDSKKNIIIEPDNGYIINSVTINDNILEIVPEEDGTYTLPLFENMTEDKHIVVTFIPKQYNVTINKNWDDNNNINEKRPSAIIVEMLYNTEVLREINMTGDSLQNSWMTSFVFDSTDENGTPYDLSKISFVEKEVNSNDLEFYDNEISFNIDNDTLQVEVTVNNTYRVPEITKEITFTKQWEDGSNEYSKRPEKIKIVAKNGDAIIKEKIIDVTQDDNITDTIYGLPYYDEDGQEITYTIDEVEVNTDDLKFYSKQIDQATYTITNTFTVPEDKTNIEVTKIWSDNSNENATRPAQIKLQVKNGTTVVQELVVDVDNTVNEKVYTFENLALYDSTGQEITYTVDEVEVNENDLIGYTKNVDGYTITNTLLKHKITTEVNGQGGAISGEGQDPYEEVNHKGDSVKDIVITPEDGYKIKSITINDEPQELPNDVYNEYSMPKFEEMTEDKHIVVEFELVEHKITTEVDGVGGTISGQNENPYETVIHTYDSTKEIKATPDSGYKITSITINGETIEFTPANDGTYTLPLFENMIEDKHIVVKFERKDTSIIIKHQTEDGTDLVTPETRPGKVGDEYRTDPIDFEEYDLKTTPDNANGNMAEEQIEVIYVYSKVKGTITVNKVDKTDSSIKLEGATFRLEKLDDTNNVDSTFEAIDKDTNEQGQAIFENLDVGKYRLTEVKAPEGYELTNEVVDVEVTKAERDVNVTASDRMKIVLPATGKINYSLIISGIGLIAITTAFVLKKKEKKASQE